MEDLNEILIDLRYGITKGFGPLVQLNNIPQTTGHTILLQRSGLTFDPNFRELQRQLHVYCVHLNK